MKGRSGGLLWAVAAAAAIELAACGRPDPGSGGRAASIPLPVGFPRPQLVHVIDHDGAALAGASVISTLGDEVLSVGTSGADGSVIVQAIAGSVVSAHVHDGAYDEAVTLAGASLDTAWTLVVPTPYGSIQPWTLAAQVYAPPGQAYVEIYADGYDRGARTVTGTSGAFVLPVAYGRKPVGGGHVVYLSGVEFGSLQPLGALEDLAAGTTAATLTLAPSPISPVHIDVSGLQSTAATGYVSRIHRDVGLGNYLTAPLPAVGGGFAGDVPVPDAAFADTFLVGAAASFPQSAWQIADMRAAVGTSFQYDAASMPPRPESPMLVSSGGATILRWTAVTTGTAKACIGYVQEPYPGHDWYFVVPGDSTQVRVPPPPPGFDPLAATSTGSTQLQVYCFDSDQVSGPEQAYRFQFAAVSREKSSLSHIVVW